MDHELVTWEAPEYEHRPQSADWFWTVGIIGLGLGITAIIFDNVLFAILLIVSTAALLLQSIKRPKVVEFAIGERGVRVMRTLYPYNTLETFWIAEDNRLLIRSEKTFMPLLSIPLANTNPEEIRDILLEFLGEEELHEPLSQRVMEFFGF